MSERSLVVIFDVCGADPTLVDPWEIADAITGQSHDGFLLSFSTAEWASPAQAESVRKAVLL